MALVLVLSLAAIMSAYLVANGLSKTTAEVQNARNQKTLQALQEAKAALIGYAASQALSSGANDQPGSLPCPDTDNDGNADACGTGASGRTGRLPWKTLGTSDLRDANGEPLWYSLSANFRTASGTTIINSDTQGQISIYDDQYSTTTPVLSNVVAVVIAPGAAVNGQNRTSNTIANFLDCRNNTLTDAFSLSLPPAGSGSTCPHTAADAATDFFNDRVLAITHADLFSVVEPMVASRIERDLKQYFATYQSEWGAYPFAATFSNPGTSTYTGTINEQWGLLPVTTSAVAWSNPAGTSPVDTNATAGDLTAATTCAASTSTQIFCDLYYTNRPTITISGTLLNVGMSFARLPVTGDVTLSNLRGTATPTPTYPGALALPLAASGSAAVQLRVRLPAHPGFGTGLVRILIDVPSYSALTSPADPYAGWFIRNQWYRQVYYAVSSALVPGGSGTCTQRPAPPAAPVSPSCLLVSNLPASYASNADKQLILVFAGRALNGAARPSATLSDYLEGANITSPTGPLYAYEHRSGRATSINDRVVVIAP